MADVSLTNLHKTFDRTEAVRGVDLDIAENEFLVLVGPSGCSFALAALAGQWFHFWSGRLPKRRGCKKPFSWSLARQPA